MTDTAVQAAARAWLHGYGINTSHYTDGGSDHPAMRTLPQAFEAYATTQLDAAQSDNAALREQIYVPGLWKCPKCKFTLVQASLRASDGAVGVRDETGDKCPNCDTGLWRVTEREAGNYLVDRCDEQMWRAIEAETKVDALRDVVRTMDRELQLIAGQCGTPDAAEGCRLILTTVERAREPASVVMGEAG